MTDETAKYKQQIIKLEKENKFLKQNIEKCNLLHDMFSEMLNIQDLASTYTYIAASLQKKFANTIVLYVSINEQRNETCLESVEGIESTLLKKIIGISGFNPVGKKFKLLPKYNDYFRSGKLVEFSGNLAEFSASEFPNFIAQTIETLIGLHKIYTIGILKEENLLAAIHLLTFSETEIGDTVFIETFVKQAGIILQKKQAETLLKESEEKNKVIVENMGEGFGAVNEYEEFIFANAESERIFDVGKGELLGKSLKNFLSEENYNFIRNETLNRKKGTKNTYELEIIKKNNQRSTILVTVTPFFDAQGKFVSTFGIFRDITSRLEIKQVLKTNNERYRIAQQMGKVGNWEYNLQTAEFWGSEQAKIIYGFNPGTEMFSTEEVEQCIIERERVHQALIDLIEKHKTYNIEFDIITRDTQERKTLASIAQLACDEFGNPVKVAGVIHDITDRKKAERALQISNERYRIAQQIGNVGNWEYNLQTAEFWGSEQAKIIFGFNPGSEMFSIEEVEQCIPERESVHQALINSNEQNQANNIEFDIIARDTQERKTIISRAQLERDKYGNPIKLKGVIHDITERKKVEQELQNKQLLLRTVIDNIPDAIYIKDLDFRKTLSNLADIHNIGATSEADVLGKNDFDLFPKEIAESFLANDKSVIQKGITLINKEEILFDNNGQQRWLLTSKMPLRNNHGQIIGLIGIGRDITKRKQAELIINRQNEELKKLNLGKDRFISILAHDLKSPFNSILGFLGLLTKNVRKYDIDKIEQQINIVNNSAKTIYSLLEDILTWVRSNSGKIPYEPQNLDFRIICNEVIENMKLTANTKSINIKYSATDDMLIFADKNMLNTIMRNLLTNAIKFTNKNGWIDIYAVKNHAEVTVTVSDNGIGIELDTLNKLFDVSQKITTDGTENEKGTGLGLLLCKEFVEKHGGKIWVESKAENLYAGKPGGSEFKFTIPLTNKPG